MGRDHGATALLHNIGDVRFTPNSDQRTDTAGCLKRADIVAKVFLHQRTEFFRAVGVATG
jgi:hypothetical protein